MWVSLSAMCLLFLVKGGSSDFLRIEGNQFYFGSNQVFLSGVNGAWSSYGYDFGNGNYEGSGPVLQDWLRAISAAGGNTIRLWIHVEGVSTPAFDTDGYVTGPDSTGDFIADLSSFLDVAAQNNVFVIPVLWNGAVMTNQNYINLVWDDSKLDSYIEKVLRPVVEALKGKAALGAWEVINEPEGSILIESHPNPCYDTLKMGDYGAGWTGNSIPIQRFLRFINKQNAAIKSVDPKALLTLGSWSEHSQNNAFSDAFNFYTNECLRGAGGEEAGIIDFYQMHSYSFNGQWNTNGPFKVEAGAYGLEKPLVIGEFASVCAMEEGVDALWDWAYNQGYAGAWSWQYNAGGHCSDSQGQQDAGMNHIRNYTHNGLIPITIQ